MQNHGSFGILICLLISNQNIKWKSQEKRTFYFLLCLAMFLSSIAHMAYDSNLKAHLTMPTFEKEPDSLADVMEMDRPFYVTNGTSMEKFVAGLPLDEAQYLFKSAIRGERYLFTDSRNMAIKEVMKGILDTRGVSVVLEIIADSFYDQYVKMFGNMPFRFSPPIAFLHGGLALEKNSAIANEINPILLNLVKGGIVEKMIKENLDSLKTARVTMLDPNANKPITMVPLVLPLISWAIGLGISGICLLAEMVWKK